MLTNINMYNTIVGNQQTSVSATREAFKIEETVATAKSEYNTLSESTPSVDNADTIESTSTESLQQFIDRFKERMGKVAEFNESTEESVVALKEALNNASLILNDVEQAKKSSDFKAVLTQTKQTLMEMVNAESYSEMKIDDKVDISNVIKTLDIIDKINVKRLDNAMVNRYINVANY